VTKQEKPKTVNVVITKDTTPDPQVRRLRGSEFKIRAANQRSPGH
jgi:hypothetical protein